MADFKSLDKEFTSFRSKLVPEEIEGASGAIVWSGFNAESNLLGEGSNINFFSSKIENFFPAKHENAADSQALNNGDSNSRLKNDRIYFGPILNDDEGHHQSSDQIFSGPSKLPSNSAFINCGQNGNFKTTSLSEANKMNSNSFDFEKIPNINILPQQSYFPFVIEYRKPVHSAIVEENEPIYVNPKQYERIIKLRLKRAKQGILRGCLPTTERSKEVIIYFLIMC